MIFQNRLTDCYKKAINNNDILEINEKTKYIFFSDVHRGDNSLSDEFAHNQNIYHYALEYYLENGFSYFELGDGDELWEHKKFENIRSAHSEVYCLLKKFYEENKLYYFFGNHNQILKNENKAKDILANYYDEYLEVGATLFPNIKIKESMILRDSYTGKEMLAIHGHQGDLMNDRLWRVSMFFVRFFWRFMHKIGFKNPASPSQSRTKRHKIEKNYSKWINNNKIGIICGHTHRPKLPDKTKSAYINTGCCVQPRGITGIELVGRNFYLIHWNVLPDKEGHLAIRKKYVKGPLSFDDLIL